MKEFFSRFNSPIVRMSVVALVLFIVNQYGLTKYIGMDDDALKLLFDLVCAVLIGFGVVNNPTDKNNF